MKSKPTTSLFRGITFLILLATGASFAQVSETKITASDGEESEYFGWTTAIAGNYAIIGASEDDDLGPVSGSAYIFKNVGSGWDEHQKLLASDGFSYDTFGNAVALSDSYAVVGAQLDDDAALNAGAVYVFKLDNGIWIEATKLRASDAADEDHFGSSVAISGDYIVVGASLDDDLGPNSGSAYVFRRDDTTWVQEAKLLASDGEIDDRFEEVSISGDYIIVGAWGDKDQGDLTGAAYIFKREGSTWIQETKLTASDAGGGDQFGLDVSMSGNYAIVGAYGNDDSGENSGSAYIFRRDSTGWIEDVKLTPGDGADFDEFGISVSISGNFALVGADVDDDSGENSGSAYLFRRDGSTWTEDLKLTASDGEPYDYFGISVALTENHLLIGAGGDDDNAFDAGAAYVFGDSVAVPVELLSFSVSVAANVVTLDWSTATEINNWIFEIERRKDNSDFITIGFVEGKGTTTERQEYSFIDKNITSGKYFYRLKQIDFDGTFEYSNEIEVDAMGPISFSLEQNFPNPFNPSTKITYSIPDKSFVTLKIFDPLGSIVTELVNEEKHSGNYEVDFDANNLPSGVYFYKIEAGSFVETKKMLLLK